MSEIDDKSDVLQVLQQQKNIYTEIHQLTDQALANQGNGQACEQLMRRVDEKTELIKANNRSMQRLLKQSAQQQTDQRRRQVEASRKEIENMALEVLKKTQQLENDLRNTRDGMIPEMNQQVVASKMFRAYQKKEAS